MKLAVKKESGAIPMGGFHYMLHPMMIKNDMEAAFYETIGYVILETNDELGLRILESARVALRHQIEVAYLTEEALKKNTK